jgi:uncharacterized YigZ family protein
LSNNHYYFTIEKPSIAEYSERGSKFIAFAFPLLSITEFKEQLQRVKSQHPKATHYCFAYRFGHEGSDFRVSDDGEPSGTAGRPILGQIDSRKLTNILIIIVRYFGGSLLGVPGLIYAYKTAASFVLQTTPILRRPIETNYQLTFDYTIIHEVMTVVKLYQCTILKQELQLFCAMTIGIAKINQEEVINRLNEFRSLQWKRLE